MVNKMKSKGIKILLENSTPFFTPPNKMISVSAQIPVIGQNKWLTNWKSKVDAFDVCK